MYEKGVLLVLSGPSGCGKGTVIQEILNKYEDVKLSISMTTRAPRAGEINGVHYHFVSRAEFEWLIQNGGMLEYAKYGDNYYGTPRRPVEEMLSRNIKVILDIEVQGADQVREKGFPEFVSVFLLPPNMQELSRRLRGRGTEDEATIQKRLEIAKWELGQADKYDFRIVNDKLEDTVRNLEQILELIEVESDVES